MMKHPASVRLLLPVIALIATLFSSVSAQHDTLHFLVISDMGGFASAEQKAVAAAMGKEADRIRASFVVTGGDNYHETGIPSENDPRWRTEFEEIYAAPSLQVPWYPTLGNHDYRGSVEAELRYSRKSPRWKLFSRYYAQHVPFGSGDTLLIVHIDTPPFVREYHADDAKYHVAGQDTAAQLRWIDSVLAVSHARWKIVVGHHPVYSSAPKHGDTDELIASLLPLLKKRMVDVYISGHDHTMQHLQRDGMEFLLCGTGAKSRIVERREETIFASSAFGFLSVEAHRTACTFSFIDTSGAVLHRLTLTAGEGKE